MSEYFLKVTPKGVYESKKSLGEILERAFNDFYRIKYIVGSEVKARIFDKALGQFWLLVEPIIMAGLYFFISTVIFTYTGQKHMFLFILTSVIFWRWFSKTIDSSPYVLLSYASVIKQTNFPIYIIILSYISTEIFLWFMSFMVLLIFLACYGIFPTTAYIYLPFVLLVQLMMTMFFTLIFAVIGTFIKDLAGVLYALTSIWWYMSPGIYPVSRIPAQYLWIYNLNPFAHILPAYRDILIDGKTPELIPLLIILIVSMFLTFFAFKLFNAAKYRFFMYL
ncbi:ABC transporter of LPS O-antigen, Wzm [Legionella moravica]|uniref:Transport permease protein n=1 Tax=Legionella moravica TaxID=39962 RepID=A0A378JZH4_9GAMM|nr:ABC transporter permease [Legionella moravica]KTD30746.1 ABC transporter of LPS O-antigen, Wzm [Legionella moravica]STX63430.1 lipopolysaccharide transport system permease [Legionella moravica]